MGLATGRRRFRDLALVFASFLGLTGVWLAMTSAPAAACGIDYESIYAASDAVFLGKVVEAGGDPLRDWDATIEVQTRYAGDVDDVVHLQGRYNDLCGPGRPEPGRVGVVYTQGDRLYWMFPADQVGLPPPGTGSRAPSNQLLPIIWIGAIGAIGTVVVVVRWRRNPRSRPGTP